MYERRYIVVKIKKNNKGNTSHLILCYFVIAVIKKEPTTAGKQCRFFLLFILPLINGFR